MTLFFSQRHGKYQSMNSLRPKDNILGSQMENCPLIQTKRQAKEHNVLKISS